MKQQSSVSPDTEEKFTEVYNYNPYYITVQG
jgi:hypothetical protein